MRALSAIIFACVLALGSGCSLLMPKKVELFQDKVQKFPRPDDEFREVQKQAADLLSGELNAITKNLLAAGSSPDEVRPVSEAASLADALSTSLGPPLKPFNRLLSYKAWSGRPLLALSDTLERETARFVDDVHDFADDNDKNAGKKIEGTGLVQIGYFSFLAIFLVFGFFAWIALKVLGTLNPPVGLGLKVAQVPVKLATKAFGQILKGGEQFKNEVKARASWTSEEILAAFRKHQDGAQDEEAKDLVKHLTNK